MNPGDGLPPSDPAASLQAIGLTAAEDAAYELLVDRPSSTLDQLATGWVRREQLASVLVDLAAKGLVQRQPGEPTHYSVIAPDIAVDALLLDNEQQLRLASEYADSLVARYYQLARRTEPSTIIEVVPGSHAVRQRLTQIQRSTRNELRCLDQAPYIHRRGKAAPDLALLANGISCRTIYDGASVEPPESLLEIEQLVLAGQEARVLPKIPMKLSLSDDRCAVLPLQREGATETIIIVHPSALLDALISLFEGLWRRALPLDLPTTDATPLQRDRSTADEQRLIALLLSGLTDEAIARQLGVSYRTAQRRIAALIRRFGVHTRFQAGIQAALRETSRRDDTTGSAS